MAGQKIIFLDIDGVINTQDITRFHKGRPGEYAYGVFTEEDYFDQGCVKCLNSIISSTDAKLVISSSWRILFDMEMLSDFFSRQNVQGEIIDYTGRMGCERGHEIQAWLNTHKGIKSFVILDDGSDMVHLSPYLVKTTWEKGLEEEHVAEAISILNRL